MNVDITNVHLDLGAGRRGTDMGPSAIHVAGLVSRLTAMGHSIDSISSIGTQSYEGGIVITHRECVPGPKEKGRPKHGTGAFPIGAWW